MSQEARVKKATNYAFIDSQNLNLGVRNDVILKSGKLVYEGKRLDFKKFRHYLRERYDVKKAYIFIGMVPGNEPLYTYLQNAGYTLIFKQTTWFYDQDGKVIVKGNVDTDIVLYAAAKFVGEYDKAIFVSGDGDFLSLYQHLEELNKLGLILVPNRYKYARILNHYRTQLRFVSDLKSLFLPNVNKKTRSDGRNTSLGLPGQGDNTNVAHHKPNVNPVRGKKI